MAGIIAVPAPVKAAPPAGWQAAVPEVEDGNAADTEKAAAEAVAKGKRHKFPVELGGAVDVALLNQIGPNNDKSATHIAYQDPALHKNARPGEGKRWQAVADELARKLGLKAVPTTCGERTEKLVKHSRHWFVRSSLANAAVHSLTQPLATDSIRPRGQGAYRQRQDDTRGRRQGGGLAVSSVDVDGLADSQAQASQGRPGGEDQAGQRPED